jgi:hypothetical protein
MLMKTSSPLHYHSVRNGIELPSFQRILLPASAMYCKKRGEFPKNVSKSFPQNVGRYIPIHKASYSTILEIYVI